MQEQTCIKTYLDGRITLIHGDCLALLPTLPKIGALVADPPYGIGYQHSGGGHGGPLTGGAAPECRPSAPIHGDDQPFDPAPLVGAAPRVLLWGADHYRARLPAGGRFLCWDKSVGQGPADSFADAEFAWTNVNAKRTVHRQLWKGLASSGADRPGPGAPRHHVSQKPRELMRWCIQVLNIAPDSLVCDPYMGSGSTGIAALGLGHRFIGIEIDAGHFATACRRIEAEIDKLGLADRGLVGDKGDT